MRRIPAVAASLILLVAGPVFGQTPAAAPASVPDVPPDGPAHMRVETGDLAGVARPNAQVFRAIPYAAAPVGDLRWAPPQPAKAWVGERQAVFPGPSCPQPMNADGKPNLGAATGPIAEDCLQLNVFAPKATANPTGKAPVIVWLHGGGHRSGAGWIYNGESFARDGVVFVAINYRLGALGYFAHPALTKAAKADEPLGSYGLMDQIAALKWVQRNIAAFGGDPANVTIMGESAGGQSTLALLTTPAAKGLYAKAIVESGLGWTDPGDLRHKETEGVQMMQAAGLSAQPTLAEMRALPLDRIVDLDADFEPFVDGRLMTQRPSQAFARGHAADVPLIIGSNSGEDSLMGDGAKSPSIARLIPPRLRAAYPTEAAQGDEALARAAFRDRYMAAPARWIAARASGGQPTFLYHFSYVGTRFRPQMTTAAHAAEIQYVLEYWGRRTPMSTVSQADRTVAALMHGCWVNFAKTGNPACADWPAYDPKTDQLLEFGDAPAVRTNFRKPQLDAQEAFVLSRPDRPK